MSNRPNPNYDTRHHYADGIQWRGYLYESAPKLARLNRVMIVEDHEDYLIISDYSRGGGWHETCKPIGEQYRVNRMGLGRPTKANIDRLRNAVKELQSYD